MANAFKSIALVARQNRPELAEILVTLVNFLQQHQIDITVEQQSAALLPNQQLRCVAYDDMGKDTDLIIVVGGDGSLLHAAKAATLYDTPVLGINRGTLGFLTDINPNHATTEVAAVLSGDYNEEQRFFLQTLVHGHSKTVAKGLALNDVVLISGKDTAQLIEFDISINKEFVCHQRSDGLIVATPTGSTAYALSAGGPIISPNLDALVLVPMFPHTLSMRPIVINANSTVEITIANDVETKPRISCDAETPINIPAGGHIDISKSERALRLIHPQNYNYFHTLRSKLRWAEKLC